MATPTHSFYNQLNQAYDFFNQKLFYGILPHCLITIQRTNRSYGYFAHNRFGTRDGQEVTDEIALNPSHFKERTTQEVLSTLVHEMVHLWQHHYGQLSRTRYHNRQWAKKMKAVGLIPSHTGQAGGKQTGQNMSHYIEPDGVFERACTELIEQGFTLPYIERWGKKEVQIRKKKTASKTKYTCPECSLNAWAKPNVFIICGVCQVTLIAQK